MNMDSKPTADFEKLQFLLQENPFPQRPLETSCFSALEMKYIPVLMVQAKIYWNLENYHMVEKIFQKSVEFCNEHDVWKLNVAHDLFLQENKYKEAIGLYKPIIGSEHEDGFIFLDSCSHGTQYCAKGNYDFGISQVIKSLEPYNKKLVTDAWYYAKRCFLSLLENMSKHMIMLQGCVVQECIQVLEHCEVCGKNVPAVTEQPLEED